MVRTVPISTLLILLAGLLIWPSGARGQAGGPNAFRITGVEVEAAGQTGAAARDKAVSDGRVIAAQTLMKRLTLPRDHERLPQVSTEAVKGLLTATRVEEEKVGPTRYVGRLTFVFDAARVGALLQAEGIPYVQTASQPVLVLPVTMSDDGKPVLWDEPNPWRDAWSRRDWQNALVPFVDPAGDLSDLQAISAEQAIEGDRAALRLVAGRYDAGYVLIAVAQSAGQDKAIALRRFNVLTGRTEDLGVETVPAGETGLKEAADNIARQLEERWKRNNLIAAGERETIVATVPIENYGYWVRLQRNLEQVSLIQERRVLNLTPAEARVSLTFAGRVEQLQAALSQVGLVLSEAPDAGTFEERRRDARDSAFERREGETDAERARRRLVEEDRRNRGEQDPTQGEGVTRNTVAAAKPPWILTLGSPGSGNP